MIRLISRTRRLLVASLIAASIGQAGLAVLAAWCIQRVFDALLVGLDQTGAGDLVSVAAAFATAALAASGLEIYRAWAGERLGVSYVSELREVLYERIINAAPETLKEQRTGGLLLPFIGDLTAIKRWVSDGFVRLISASAMGVVLLTALATASLVLAAASGLILVCFGAVLFWMSGPLSLAIREARSKRGAVANFVTSSLGAASTIQLFDKLPRELKRLRRRNDALMHASLRLARLTGMMSAISHLTSVALMGATLAIGIVEVGAGVMTAGSVAAAMSIAGLLANVIRDLGVSFDLGRRADAAFARVSVTMKLPSLVRASGSRRQLAGDQPGLVLENASIAGILEDVSAAALPNTITQVVGASGSGKSALIAAIAGMRPVDGGRILLGGRNISRTPTSWLRRRIGFAGPSVPLLRGTLGMNLRYRRPNAADAEIEQVIDCCNLQPVVDRLPQGLATRLSDGAPELSKGEIARVLIARAMLGSPDMLLLDEMDIHLDELSATRIAASLRDFAGVIVLTATCPAFQQAAQEIWRIEEGGLRLGERVESGAGPGPAEITSTPSLLAAGPLQ